MDEQSGSRLLWFAALALALAPPSGLTACAELCGTVDAWSTCYAEVHGDDVRYMEAVWADVQNRMAELSSRPDTTGQAAIPPGT